MPARRTAALELLVHLGLLLPLALLLLDLGLNRLTANPIQMATQRTGAIALVFLVLSLACTPIYRVVRLRALLWLRRMLGLYAFAYAGVHVVIFVGVDYRFDGELLWGEVFEKRYALAGLASLLLLSLPALTSFGTWSRRLGALARPVHQAVYLAALFAVLHYLWLAKVDRSEPLWYGAIVVIILLLRLTVVEKAREHLRPLLERRSRKPVRPEHREG